MRREIEKHQRTPRRSVLSCSTLGECPDHLELGEAGGKPPNRINAPPSTRDADKKYYVGQDAKHAADVIRNVGNTTSKNI
jgi:hypothetical protein